MVIGIVLGLLAIGFLLGMFDDPNKKPSKQSGANTAGLKNKQNEIHFDPWKDEWYGNGPWWKKW